MNKNKENNKEAKDNFDESLIKNTKNFISSTNLVYKNADYTSASILYFIALFSIYDLIILREKGYTPKDHTERFRILEKDYLEYYHFLDKNFEIYQKSYNKSIEKEVCDKIKENVERIAKEQKILENS